MHTTRTHILIYSGITLLLTVVLNFYISNNSIYQSKIKKIDGNYNALNQAEKTSATGKLLLVIGNSYVNASFNYSEKNENILRFTVFGMSLIDAVNIVENLPTNTSVNAILVGLGYNYATPVGAYSSSYDKHFTSNPVKSLWSSVPMVRGRSIASTIIKEDISCLLSNILSIKCGKKNTEKKAETTSPISTKNHKSKIISSTRKRLKEYLPFTSSVGTNFQLYIKRLKDACNKRGISLYTYTAPIYKELRNQLDPIVLEKFRSIIKINSIDYVDMNLVYPNWEAVMFSDATHVIQLTAGNVTTEFLMDRIVSGHAHHDDSTLRSAP